MRHMSYQGVNLEVMPMLKETLQMLDDETIPAFKRVAEESVDAAEYTGIPNLIEGCKKQEESAQLVLNSLYQCREALENYINYYQKIAEATGAI